VVSRNSRNGHVTSRYVQLVKHWAKPAALSNEKALRETQTLRAGCSKAEPKISPCHRPPSRGRGTKFNQLEMVTTFTYRPSLARINACNLELSW